MPLVPLAIQSFLRVTLGDHGAELQGGDCQCGGGVGRFGGIDSEGWLGVQLIHQRLHQVFGGAAGLRCGRGHGWLCGRCLRCGLLGGWPSYHSV